MPQIGEIIKDKHSNTYIWHACETCGKERWVQLKRGHIPIQCVTCSNKARAGVQFSRETRRKMSKARLGEKNSQWRGGITKSHSAGYIRIKLLPTDALYPMADSTGYIYEHRLLMARGLGYCLTYDDVVHHKNKIKDDNNRENLEQKTRGLHTKEHCSKKGLALCGYCGKEITVMQYRLKNSQTASVFCSLHCAQKKRWVNFRERGCLLKK